MPRSYCKKKSRRRQCREMRKLKLLKRNRISIKKEVPKEHTNASSCLSTSHDLLAAKPQETLGTKLFISYDQNMESDIITPSTEFMDPLAIDATQFTLSTEKPPDIFIPLESESLVVLKIEEDDEINVNVAKDNFEQFLKTISERAAMKKKERNASRPKSRRRACREMRKLKLLKRNGISIRKGLVLVPEKDINTSSCSATSDDLQLQQTHSPISILKTKPLISYAQNMETNIMSVSTQLKDPLAIDKTPTTSTTEKDILYHKTQSLSRESDTFIPLDSEALVVPKTEDEGEINPNVAKDNFEEFGRFVASQLGNASPERAAKLQDKITFCYWDLMPIVSQIWMIL